MFITYKTHDTKRSVLFVIQTRLKSVGNGLKNISVRSPHWRSNFEKTASELRISKLKFKANQETLIKNEFLLNFHHELLSF